MIHFLAMLKQSSRFWIGAMFACLFLISGAAHGQIALVSTSVTPGSGSSNTNILTIDTPSGVVQNDLLLVQISLRRGSTSPDPSPPAGWTRLLRINNGTTVSQVIYYKFAGLSEPASYTFTLSLSQRAAIAASAFRGVDPASPFNATATAVDSGVFADSPSVTTTVANTALLVAQIQAHGGLTAAPPAGMTELIDLSDGSGPNGSNVYLAYQDLPGTGATGIKTVSLDRSALSANATIALRPIVINNSSNAANFDCLETGVAYSTSARKPLYTKLAGTAFSFDAVALKSDGTQETNFVASGSPDKNVTVELFAAPAGAFTCSALTSPLASQTVTFGSSDTGRKTISSVTLSNAHPSLICRVTDTNSGSAVYGCSSDRFTVRPASITSVTASANADATGVSPSATPAVKAGQAFSITAGAAVAGYNGTPKVNTSLMNWAAVSGGVLGSLSGSFTTPASAVNGNGATGNFAYSEAGYFRFLAQGVYDDTFAANSSDIANGDCVPGFSNILVGGKYGCYFGTTAATSYFGRFIPDHFDVQLTAACGISPSNFTYAGQPMQATVTARNVSNGAVLNYAASVGFAKGVTLSAVTPGSGGSLSGASVAASGFVLGQALPSVSYAFSAKETAPQNLQLRATDSDGVSSLGFVEESVPLRSGRLRIADTYGSDQSTLSVPIQVQYWSGSSWLTSTQDTCTTLSAANVYRSGIDAPTANTSIQSVSLANGAGSIVLAKPSSAGSFHVGANLGASGTSQTCLSTQGGAAANLPWLRSLSACASTADRDPHAKATFGIFKSETRRQIHIRELR